MESTDLLFAVLGPVLAGIFATAGYGAIGVTPADFKKARVCFVLAAVCLGGIPIVWGFTTIHPLWARLVVTALFGAVAVSGLTEGLRWLAGREHGIVSQELSKQIVVPAPPNPGFELTHGPYEREEIRLMILALGAMHDVLEKQIRTAFARIQQTTDNWALQMDRMGPDVYDRQLNDVRTELATAINNLHKIVFDENTRFADELRPTIEDPKDAANALNNSLFEFGDNLCGLSKVAKDVDIKSILGRDANRIQRTIPEFIAWTNLTTQRITTKIRRLRDYKQ
jgi:hypothetical protein